MYTSEKKLFVYLRNKLGVNKPYALPICVKDADEETWDDWDSRVKDEKPVAYFITETLPDWIDNVDKFLFDWYRNLRYYVRNRFFSRLHVLSTGLNPGQYYDLDTRILHGLFNELTNFVEIELAWMHVVFDDSPKYKIPFYRSWFGWRCPEAGLDHLKWGMSLVYTSDEFAEEDNPKIGKPTLQAEAAKEQWILYHWWKNYLDKSDPYEMWHDFNDEMRVKYDEKSFTLCTKHRSQEDRDRGDKLFELARIENQRIDDEVNEMTIRLMKIRRSLWT